MYATFEIDPKKHKSELKSIKKLYKNSFPPEEREPWYLLKRGLKIAGTSKIPYNKTYTTMLGIKNVEDPSKVLGFAIIVYIIPSNFCFGNYIAIEPEYRNKGLGSAFVNEIKKYFMELANKFDAEKPIGFFYEIDKHDLSRYGIKDREQIFARYRFYNRLNQKKIDVPYFQPALRSWLPKVPMYLMFGPIEERKYFSKEEILRIYTNIYSVIYHKSEKSLKKLFRRLNVVDLPNRIDLISLDSIVQLK